MVPVPAEIFLVLDKLDEKLAEIVTDLVNNASLDADSRPSFVHDLGDVRTLAPLMPGKMLNAAVNFYSHVDEANTPEEQRAAAERRRGRAPVEPVTVEDVVAHGGFDKAL